MSPYISADTNSRQRGMTALSETSPLVIRNMEYRGLLVEASEFI